MEVEIVLKYILLPPSPLPQRLKKKNEEGKYQKFISMLKEFSVNMPLAEVLEKMP